MQAFFWLAVRAFTKFGIAIAANNPMMATTIMISTRVKPALLFVLICITLLSVFSATRREQRKRRVYYYYLICSRIAFCNRESGTSNRNAIVSSYKRTAKPQKHY